MQKKTWKKQRDNRNKMTIRANKIVVFPRGFRAFFPGSTSFYTMFIKSQKMTLFPYITGGIAGFFVLQ